MSVKHEFITCLKIKKKLNRRFTLFLAISNSFLSEISYENTHTGIDCWILGYWLSFGEFYEVLWLVKVEELNLRVEIDRFDGFKLGLKN